MSELGRCAVDQLDVHFNEATLGGTVKTGDADNLALAAFGLAVHDVSQPPADLIRSPVQSVKGVAQLGFVHAGRRPVRRCLRREQARQLRLVFEMNQDVLRRRGDKIQSLGR